MSVKIVREGTFVKMVAPFHPKLPPGAKNIGGRWDKNERAWIFDARDEERVRALARSIYGTDGVAVPTVTVRHRVTSKDAVQGELWLFDRIVAWRKGRDLPVRLGEGTIVVDGGFPKTGGSLKYPEIRGIDTVLEIRDVPATLVTEDDNTWVVGGNAKRAQIEARIVELRAELASLERQLAEM